MEGLGGFGETLSELFGDVSNGVGDIWDEVVEGGGHYLKGLADHELEKKQTNAQPNNLVDPTQATVPMQPQTMQPQNSTVMGLDSTTALVLVVGSIALFSLLRKGA